MDNLAASNGEEGYYHIPTISIKDLAYGTYTLQLTATSAGSAAAGTARYEYVLDGVRIHNPLGNAATYQPGVVKDAYGLETNAVFTEVRDILLSYGDFNTDITDSTDGKMGAVFIDQVLEGQGTPVGTGVSTYEIGTYESVGPKNEVYLAAGQAIVLKVEEGNRYYVGLKSLTGAELTVNVSGIDLADPTSITLSHTTDMYYQVTPVGGYIVIQNANTTSGAILSITNLRTTNMTGPAENGGVLQVKKQEALALMEEFTAYLIEKQNAPQPDDDEEKLPTAEEQAQVNAQLANEIFTDVRRWLNEEV